MLIRDVRARWLHCPIPAEQQHVSDFGRIESFDTAIISIEVDNGLVGWGEAKAAVDAVDDAGEAQDAATRKSDLRRRLPAHAEPLLGACWLKARGGAMSR